MWDPKEQQSTFESRQQQYKKNLEEERGADSGFLSGPQTASDIDIELSREDVENLNIAPVAEKVDERKILEQQQQQKEQNYIDSGLVEEIDDYDEDDDDAGIDIDDNNTSEPKMLLDHSLSERLSSLSLKTDGHQLNDLGKRSNATSASKNSRQLRSKNVVAGSVDQEVQPWEMYYQQNDDGDTQLHLAIIQNCTDVAFTLIRLALHPCLLDIKNDDAQAALHLAVLTSQSNIVRRLLVAGVDATTRDRNGNTPLHLACIHGDLTCVKALTAPITAVEMQEARRETDALKLPAYPCTQLPQDLEQRNYDGEHFVHLAAQGNKIEILRHLVWLSADINAREGKSGRTPLHMAVESGNEMLTNFLLEECPHLNLETCTYAGLTAYQFARIVHNKSMQRNLSKKGAEQLTPPQSSDEDSDFDEPLQMFGHQSNQYFQMYNGGNAINVA